jgi:hypothetical protein
VMAGTVMAYLSSAFSMLGNTVTVIAATPVRR